MSYRHILLIALGFGLLVFLSENARAQMRRSQFGTSRVSLATLPPIQEELKFTDEQKKLADELHDGLTEDRREVFQTGGGDFDAMRVKIEELDAAATREFVEQLDDTQRKRLTEIYVQANGTNALADPSVIEELQISDEQQAKLNEARNENRQAFFGAFQNFQGMSDDERREKMANLQKEADDRLLTELTDDQRTAFGKMPGAEIEFDLTELRGGFGGGGGRRPSSNTNRPQRPQ